MRLQVLYYFLSQQISWNSCEPSLKEAMSTFEIHVPEQRRHGLAAALGISSLGDSLSLQKLILADEPYQLLTVGKPQQESVESKESKKSDLFAARLAFADIGNSAMTCCKTLFRCFPGLMATFSPPTARAFGFAWARIPEILGNNREVWASQEELRDRIHMNHSTNISRASEKCQKPRQRSWPAHEQQRLWHWLCVSAWRPGFEHQYEGGKVWKGSMTPKNPQRIVGAFHLGKLKHDVENAKKRHDVPGLRQRNSGDQVSRWGRRGDELLQCTCTLCFIAYCLLLWFERPIGLGSQFPSQVLLYYVSKPTPIYLFGWFSIFTTIKQATIQTDFSSSGQYWTIGKLKPFLSRRFAAE